MNDDIKRLNKFWSVELQNCIAVYVVRKSF